MTTPVLSDLVRTLATSLNRDPEDLLDAYGQGEAVALFDEDKHVLFAFICAQPIPPLDPRDVAEIGCYRMITLVWTNSSLDQTTSDQLREEMARELLRRLRTKRVVMDMTMLRHITKPGDQWQTTDPDAHIKHRVPQLLGEGVTPVVIEPSQRLRQGTMRVLIPTRHGRRLETVHDT